MKNSRNVHRKKTVAVKEELKDVKKKNKTLSKMLSVEQTKSTEINHRALLDKRANLTLLTKATKSHQTELKKQQDETKEKLQDEHRRFNEELKKQQARPKKNYGTNADGSMKNLKNDRTRTKKNY